MSGTRAGAIGAVKHLVAAVWYRSGFLALWWRWSGRRRRGRPTIVMYHRVLDRAAGLDLSQPGLVVTTPTFERQLKLLARLFRVVPFSTAAESSDPDLAAITFDDGWADNATEALPVLRRLGLGATVFVTTGLIGTPGLFWPERLAALLGGPGRRRLDPGALDGLETPVREALIRVSRAPDRRLAGALDLLIERTKALGEVERQELLELVEAAVGSAPAADGRPRLLDWSQVRELAHQGFEIGGHGVTHAILTRVDFQRAVAEIAGSRRAVAEVLGAPPESFAYPNGEATPELARAVREAGYKRAVVADAPSPPGCPPELVLQRQNLSEGSSRGVFGFSAAVFACEILGWFDALRRPAWLAGFRRRRSGGRPGRSGRGANRRRWR